jgi:hypothetical protein
METRKVRRDEKAELKLRVIPLQERVAELARSGQIAKAREARQELYRLLNQIDILEHDERRGLVVGRRRPPVMSRVLALFLGLFT